LPKVHKKVNCSVLNVAALQHVTNSAHISTGWLWHGNAYADMTRLDFPTST